MPVYGKTGNYFRYLYWLTCCISQSNYLLTFAFTRVLSTVLRWCSKTAEAIPQCVSKGLSQRFVDIPFLNISTNLNRPASLSWQKYHEVCQFRGKRNLWYQISYIAQRFAEAININVKCLVLIIWLIYSNIASMSHPLIADFSCSIYCYRIGYQLMHTNIIQNILGVPGIFLKPNQENIRTSLQLLRPRKYPQEYLCPGF